ncbi:hypothetical protein SAMN05216215_102859 [Saccharopolyspora shandongensis]|uniref:Uncharacterized protein n=1 Tax=Saccharopolyspora shandongensis TaxID=418495 RepID=A0A1H3KIH7_9PSEU|nr:hypothetical protein [Saccharopolyspora shandongensis]SDY52012.1 hypothetical protein SAMN05216215_102859 [Saccharopolyspora shandongensis]
MSVIDNAVDHQRPLWPEVALVAMSKQDTLVLRLPVGVASTADVAGSEAPDFTAVREEAERMRIDRLDPSCSQRPTWKPRSTSTPACWAWR